MPGMQFSLSEPYPCPYLPDRFARMVFTNDSMISPETYRDMLSANFRRSGTSFYRPHCDDCTLCRQLKVDCAAFEPSASQKRSLAKNRDITISFSKQLDDTEALELYCRFVQERHAQTSSIDDAREFLGVKVLPGILLRYCLGERLVGAGWLDVLPDGLSSVYFAFDPAESKRSLGVFSAVQEIMLARKLGLPWLYFGYWVVGSKTMHYKADYRPHYILEQETWLPGKA